MKKKIVVYSGGVDSTTVLYDVVKQFGAENVIGLSFNYGSKHNKKELEFAKWHAKKLNLEHRIIELDFNKIGFKSSLLQSGEDIPEGMYDESNMASTVVPFRNGIMLSLAAGFADSNNGDTLYLGSHAGDHCFTSDMKILTTGGLKTVNELNIKEQVFSFNLTNKCWEVDEVCDIIKKNKVAVVNEIVTRAGNIKLTDEHKVYRLKLKNFNSTHGYDKDIEKVSVSELREGDYLVQPTNLIAQNKELSFDIKPIIVNILKKYNNPPKLNIKDGIMWLGGDKYKRLGIREDVNNNLVPLVNLLTWYIAEGWSSKTPYKSIRGESRLLAVFSLSLKANLDKVELIDSTIASGNFSIKREFSKVMYNDIPKEVVYYSSNILALLMKECGSHSAIKHIPDWLMNILMQNIDLREEFIHTITLADGYNSYRDIKGFCSKSEKLIEQMTTLLQMSGYHFSFTKNKNYSVVYITYSKKGKKSALIAVNDAKFTEIKKINKIDYNDYVYDISIKKNHNFLCGDYGQILISNSVYKDCRVEFTQAMNKAVELGTDNEIKVISLYNNLSKSDVVARGLELGVPYEKTWSCYKGQENPCLVCGTCTERTEAFLDNNLKDPSLSNIEWDNAIKAYHNFKENGYK